MKSFINKGTSFRVFTSFLIVCLLVLSSNSFAQDSAAVEQTPAPVKLKPVKNTFSSVWLIDNQTVMVPIKGTMEMDIQHRFGTINKGTEDLWGLMSSANIRLGMSYSPINKLNLGIGITKIRMLLDLSLKYSIITQTPGKYPVSITYFGDAADDTRKDATIFDGSEIKHNSDRYSFFNELIIARKISDRLSVQVAPSLSHQNAVPGYYYKKNESDTIGKTVFKYMKNDHFAIAFAARYKLTEVTSLMVDYDQPLTDHPTNNPHPNLSFGCEFNTSGHSFQVFFTNFGLLNPQQNNLYNANDPFKELKWVNGGGPQYVIGFNITRLWNY